MKVQTVFIPFSDLKNTPPFKEIQAWVSHNYVDPVTERHFKNTPFYPGQVVVFNRTDGLIGINSMEGDGDKREFDALYSTTNYYSFIPIQPGGSALESNSFNMTAIRLYPFETLTQGDVVVSFYNYRM